MSSSFDCGGAQMWSDWADLRHGASWWCGRVFERKFRALAPSMATPMGAAFILETSAAASSLYEVFR